MPVHALDVFIEIATKTVSIIPLNTKNEDKPLWYDHNFAFSYAGVRQGMGIMHLNVMDSVSIVVMDGTL